MQKKVELNADIIYGFAGSCLAGRFDGQFKTPAFHKEMWELCTSKNPLVAIAAPRGHAKSTAITHTYVLAALLFRDRKYCLLVSDTEGQANQFLGDIKSELDENETIKELFGIEGFEKDTESDCIVRCTDGHKFRIQTRGSEQKVRGLKWDGARPDLIVCDDLENDEIVLNSERRDKFRRWFYGALLPCRSTHGIVRYVGTILHLDSLLERLMPKTWDKATVTEELKQYSTRVRTPWKAVKYKAHNPDFTQILWPEKFTKQALLDIRQDYLDQGIPEVYGQEYLNYPIDESNAFFRKSDFLAIQDEDRKKKVHYYAAIDFAISQSQRSDYTVVAVAGVDEAGMVQVRNIIRERMDAKDIIDTMFHIQRLYEPELFTVESGAIEKALGPFLRDEMLKRDTYINLFPVVPTKDKITRARGIQARMRAGGVKFDKGAEWYPAFEEEFLRFPKDKHDDQVDALAWVGLTLDKYIQAPTQQEVEDEEYEDEYDKTMNLSGGRNRRTGY